MYRYVVLLLVLPLFGCGKVCKMPEVATNKEVTKITKIEMPLTTPGYGGVTQSPEVFNYYISVLEKSLGKLPCHAKAGDGVEPCMTETFKEIERRITKECSRE